MIYVSLFLFAAALIALRSSAEGPRVSPARLALILTALAALLAVGIAVINHAMQP